MWLRPSPHVHVGWRLAALLLGASTAPRYLHVALCGLRCLRCLCCLRSTSCWAGVGYAVTFASSCASSCAVAWTTWDDVGWRFVLECAARALGAVTCWDAACLWPRVGYYAFEGSATRPADSSGLSRANRSPRPRFRALIGTALESPAELESPASALSNVVPMSAWKQGTGGWLMSEGPLESTGSALPEVHPPLGPVVVESTSSLKSPPRIDSP